MALHLPRSRDRHLHERRVAHRLPRRHPCDLLLWHVHSCDRTRGTRIVKTLYIKIGETVSSKYPPQPLYLGVTMYLNLAVIGQPRIGKGGVIKPVVVKISKERPICVFDFK